MTTDPVLIVKELLNKLGVEFSDVKEEAIAGQTLVCVVAPTSDTLIGKHGMTLRSLELLARKMRETAGEKEPFTVDVNEYRKKQIEEVQGTARLLAERARMLEYDVEMTPMNAYDRLIVHATLADEKNLNTESKGEGKERRIVIRYTAAV